MDLVDTLPDVRYWSEVLCLPSRPTSVTLRSRSRTWNFKFKFLEVYIFWSFSSILLMLCLMLDTVWSFMLYHHNPHQWSWDQGFMLYHHDPHQWPWSQGHGLWIFKLKFLDVYIFWSFSLILLILCLILGTGLKFNAAPSPPHHQPWGQGHGFWNFTLKFLVKRF